jgi:ABC-type dipeptide/oligopeptide/nickel transport system permease component
MTRYIFGRISGLLFAVVIVTIITFALMHAVPGGPFDEIKQPLPEVARQNILRKYGLDKPVWEQYLLYMWSVLHGDFGIPFQSPTETVTELIARVWVPTLQIGAATITIAYTLGTFLGISAALNRNTWIDYSVTTLATLGIAVPNWVIAIWMIIIFSISLHWLPTGGWGEPVHYLMPVTAYALAPMALVARYTRTSMLEVLQADYVRTARAKGAGRWRVIIRHALSNALLPLITVLGPQIPNLATGSIFIESTFRIPGLGRFFVTSTFLRDYPMIMATIILVAILWGVTYALSDILYSIVDPRVRLTGGG